MDKTDIEEALLELQTSVTAALATPAGAGVRNFEVGDYRVVVAHTGVIVEMKRR